MRHNTQCCVEGCTRLTRSQVTAYCQKHQAEVHKHGHILTKAEKARNQKLRISEGIKTRKKSRQDPLFVARGDAVRQLPNVSKICTVKGCEGKMHARGLCMKHYKRLRDTGSTADTPRCFKTGRTTTAQGYIYQLAKNHPNATLAGYVSLHRLMMEEALGRYLTREEVVHHKNGNKSDNNIANLELFPSSGAHTKHHARLRRAKKEAHAALSLVKGGVL